MTISTYRRHRLAPTGAKAAIVTVGAAALVAGSVGPAEAAAPPDDRIGTGYHWGEEEVTQTVSMADPWVFRGPTDYTVRTQPVCWSYADRPQDLVAAVEVSAPDRYEPFPFDPDRLFFPVDETVTVDWHNTTTGASGRDVVHGTSGVVEVGVYGGDGVIEMDIHLRSDQPWMNAAGSTDLPFGHAEGSLHAAVDLTGKSCP